MDEQALYKAIAPELEHTDEEHARDIIRIIRAVLLARDREIARELRPWSRPSFKRGIMCCCRERRSAVMCAPRGIRSSSQRVSQDGEVRRRQGLQRF
jgi:hypothetical protein